MTPTTHHFQASELPYWTKGNLLPILEIEEDCVNVRIDDTRVQIWNSTHGERPIADIWKVQTQRWLRENERKALGDVYGNYNEIISVLRAVMQKLKTQKIVLNLTADELNHLERVVYSGWLTSTSGQYDALTRLYLKVKEATK